MKTRVDRVETLELLDLPEELIKYNVSDNINDNDALGEATKVMATLSSSCHKMYQLFKPELDARGAKVLLTAVLQGNEAFALKVALSNPGLFFIKSTAMDYAMDLEGNRRTIKGWSPYQALFAGDVDMLAKVRPYLYAYLKALPNGFDLAMNQELEKFPHGFDFPVCADEFSQLLTELEMAISLDQQLILNWNNPAPMTSSLLVKFRNYLKPDEVSAGHHFNMNHFIKAHGIYDTHFSENSWNWNQSDFYYVYVMGFLERLFPSCYLQRACQGGFEKLNEPLRRSFTIENYVTQQEIIIAPLDMYPSCRLGENIAVDTDYGVARGAHFPIEGWCRSYFEKLCQSNTMRYSELSFSQSCERVAKTRETNQGLDFQKVFFGASTGHLMQNLYRFMPPKDRSRLSGTCKDTHRFEKIDNALTQVHYKEMLMQDILRVLETDEYERRLKVCRNPSGFLRLSDVIQDLNPHLLSQLPEACNVRLNFWPGKTHAHLGADFSLETRHSHPRSFCSFIVSEGYEHHLYLDTNNCDDQSMDVVKVTVAPDGKTFVLQNTSEYQSPAIYEKLMEGSQEFSYFSTGLIHEVVDRINSSENRDEGTLTINIVFNSDNKDTVQYNLYLHEYDKNNIVESYTELPRDQARMALDVVKNILKEKIEEKMCKDVSQAFKLSR